MYVTKVARPKAPKKPNRNFRVGSIVAVKQDDEEFVVGKITKKIETYYTLMCLKNYPSISGSYYYGERRLLLVKISVCITLLKLNSITGPEDVENLYQINGDDLEMIQRELKAD